jgi:hypothetical protein
MLDRGKRDKDPVSTPEGPTGGSIGHAVFDHHAHRQVDHTVGVMAPGWGKIGEIDVAMLRTAVTGVRRVGHQEVHRTTGRYIAQVV